MCGKATGTRAGSVPRTKHCCFLYCMIYELRTIDAHLHALTVTPSKAADPCSSVRSVSQAVILVEAQRIAWLDGAVDPFVLECPCFEAALSWPNCHYIGLGFMSSDEFFSKLVCRVCRRRGPGCESAVRCAQQRVRLGLSHAVVLRSQVLNLVINSMEPPPVPKCSPQCRWHWPFKFPPQAQLAQATGARLVCSLRKNWMLGTLLKWKPGKWYLLSKHKPSPTPAFCDADSCMILAYDCKHP